MMSSTTKKRALFSVYDKSGAAELAQKLTAVGYEIIASGGTAEILSKAGISVTSVESVTGSDEILGGRVKTLHPLIHGAILADLSKPDHLADLSAKGITLSKFKVLAYICRLESRIVYFVADTRGLLCAASSKSREYLHVFSASNLSLLSQALKEG